MDAVLQNPIFQDETKAREWLEARVWPDGPVCPHCGAPEALVTKLEGQAHRPGVFQCNQCREQFTVTVGTVFERSKLPLTKWLAALFLMTASKKGVSAHQVHRMLKISYKSTWFMMHRLREAMRVVGVEPMGGAGEIVEIDETFIGRLEGMPTQPKAGGASAFKNTVLSLVTRGGEVRSFHVEGTTSGQLLPIIRANISKEAFVISDQWMAYGSLGKEYWMLGLETIQAQSDPASQQTVQGARVLLEWLRQRHTHRSASRS